MRPLTFMLSRTTHLMAMIHLCRHRTASSLLQLQVNGLTDWLPRIGGLTSQFSRLFPVVYTDTISMKSVVPILRTMSVLYPGDSVCKYGLLSPGFAPLFRVKCEQSNQSCDHGERRTIPFYTKSPLPVAPPGSALLYSLCLRRF